MERLITISDIGIAINKLMREEHPSVKGIISMHKLTYQVLHLQNKVILKVSNSPDFDKLFGLIIKIDDRLAFNHFIIE